jgi:hypothetical protein
MSHLDKGVVMATGHFQGCKLVASIDKASGQVCALEVQFKNAKPRKGLAKKALKAWRPALASYSYTVPNSLVRRGWKRMQPSGATYQVMTLLSPGHHVDTCCNYSKGWKTIEP